MYAIQSNDRYAPTLPKRSRAGKILAASAAVLAATALYNVYEARKAERRHPPSGRFVTVDGVRLHYIEKGTGKGEGPPIVLLHGNVVTAEDFVLSGLLDRLARRHRVIAIDRPGFGYSDRPLGSAWGAEAQADLLRQAFDQLGIDRPVVVGHSWGTLVALELALEYPDAVSSLVLLSGYYYATMRADVPLFASPAIPIVGDVLRYTVSPLVGSAILPALIKGMFAPLPVPEGFEEGLPRGFPIRPSQIRAESQDTATMIPGVIAMRGRFPELHMPVTIMAGAEDYVVDMEEHAVRLHESIPQSTLRLVPGVGHMVHHAVPDEVADAIEDVAAAATAPSGSLAPSLSPSAVP